MLLLHGLLASSDSFGRAFDAPAANGCTVAVPDLLGFGRSRSPGETAFTIERHLETLDEVAERLGLLDGPLVVAGHSLGGVLAIEWAARHAGAVERVVTWGAPLHPDRRDAVAAIAGLGLMERLFALDTRSAEAACRLVCRYRRTARLVAVLASPQLPVAVSRRAVDHTWPAYQGAMEEIVLSASWPDAVRRLDDHGVRTVLVRGEADRIVDGAVYAGLAEEHDAVDVLVRPGAGHLLPLTDAPWAAGLLDPSAAGSRP